MLVTFALAVALTGVVEADDEGIIRLVTEDRVIAFKTDGTKQSEAKNELADGRRLSPDGKRSVFRKDGAIYVGNKDGGDARRLSPEGVACLGSDLVS
jgi:hypothetical protein